MSLADKRKSVFLGWFLCANSRLMSKNGVRTVGVLALPGKEELRRVTNVGENASPSTSRLIVVPALIATGVTALRAFGEVHQWPEPLVNSAVCGKAILGVVWLVPIFGIYFALRLFRAGSAPKFVGRPMIFAMASLPLKLLGTFVMERPGVGYITRVSLNFVVTLPALVLQAVAWPDLFRALLAYGYASRIPIAVVEYLAMRGHWGTHYDALDPGFPQIGFWQNYARVNLVPNIFFMEAYTVVVGGLLGIFAVAAMRRLKPSLQ